MEIKKAYKVFRYQNDVRWGSDRRGKICSSGKPDIEISSPPEFKGEAGFWTPEDMFIASVNTCTLMTFLAFARHKGLEFVSYASAAEGVLENVEGRYRFTEIVLHPHIVLRLNADIDRTRQILEDAHKSCLVSNSITTTVKIYPDIRVATVAA